MLIQDLIQQKTVFSVEVFPPKKEEPPELLLPAVKRFSKLKPDFISVTYGAGGSTKKGTQTICEAVIQNHRLPALAHLTCVFESPKSIDRIALSLKEKKVRSVLALRGDIPHGQDPKKATAHFSKAVQLISYLREHHAAFEIGAAAYPEGHLECESFQQDLYYLKKKVEAGVDFLITQLFFHNDHFYRFLEKARNMGIEVPILPGIMPVTSKKQVDRILSMSRTDFPPKFRRMLERYEHNPAALKEAGTAYATEQIIDLLSFGTDGIHLYAMNKPALAEKIFSDTASIRACLRESAG